MIFRTDLPYRTRIRKWTAGFKKILNLMHEVEKLADKNRSFASKKGGRSKKVLNEFVDNTARRPSGRLEKMMYRNPRSHYQSFHLTMNKLQLKPDDIFLEIGCGGGVLLDMALKTAKQAKAIDHSIDMVQIARERNHETLTEGRLEIVQGNAETLPWDDNTFTCAAASNMFFFIENPMTVLYEIHRVLRPGGRLVITSTEDTAWVKIFCFPWAHSMRLYKNPEMEDMLKQAGFYMADVKTEKFIQVSYAIK